MSDKVSVFELMRIIRDARSTRGAQRAVLNAIALRCKPEEDFKCWPSYARLAVDCQLDRKTVTRAAKALVKAKIIAIRERSQKSNLFFINYPLLVKQADAIKAQTQSIDYFVVSPFASVDEADAAHDIHQPSSASSWLTGGVR